MKKAGLIFNPRLVLIGFRTTGAWLTVCAWYWQELDRVKSDLAAAEGRAAVIEAEQAKGLEEVEEQFRKEVEVLQEYLNSQEKEFLAEIDRTKVGLHFGFFLYSLKKLRCFQIHQTENPNWTFSLISGNDN